MTPTSKLAHSIRMSPLQIAEAFVLSEIKWYDHGFQRMINCDFAEMQHEDWLKFVHTWVEIIKHNDKVAGFEEVVRFILNSSDHVNELDTLTLMYNAWRRAVHAEYPNNKSNCKLFIQFASRIAYHIANRFYDGKFNEQVDVALSDFILRYNHDAFFPYDDDGQEYTKRKLELYCSNLSIVGTAALVCECTVLWTSNKRNELNETNVKISNLAMMMLHNRDYAMFDRLIVSVNPNLVFILALQTRESDVVAWFIHTYDVDVNKCMSLDKINELLNRSSLIRISSFMKAHDVFKASEMLYALVSALISFAGDICTFKDIANAIICILDNDWFNTIHCDDDQKQQMMCVFSGVEKIQELLKGKVFCQTRRSNK